MEIDITIPREDLNLLARIKLLEQIAVGATREAGDGPREAVMALMAAAALVSISNGGTAPDMVEIIPTAIEAAQKIIDAQLLDDEDIV